MEVAEGRGWVLLCGCRAGWSGMLVAHGPASLRQSRESLHKGARVPWYRARTQRGARWLYPDDTRAEQGVRGTLSRPENQYGCISHSISHPPPTVSGVNLRLDIPSCSRRAPGGRRGGGGGMDKTHRLLFLGPAEGPQRSRFSSR